MSDKKFTCKQCGSSMYIKKQAKHNQGVCILIIFGGLALLTVNIFVGIVTTLTGMVMGSGMKKTWICKNCGWGFEDLRG